eukprot:6466899-Amphidinium_carterae.1
MSCTNSSKLCPASRNPYRHRSSLAHTPASCERGSSDGRSTQMSRLTRLCGCALVMSMNMSTNPASSSLAGVIAMLRRNRRDSYGGADAYDCAGSVNVVRYFVSFTTSLDLTIGLSASPLLTSTQAT